MTNDYVWVDECPACLSKKYVIWLNDSDTTKFVKCSDCGTIFANPRSSKTERFHWLDEKFGLSEKSLENADNRFFNLQEEASIIQKKINHGSLLDIGCDLGDFFQFFPVSNWNFFGVDISPSAVEYASRKYDANIMIGELFDANYSENYFDLVTILDTMYYLDSPKNFFDEVKRILKEDGILAVEISGLKYQIIRSNGLFCYLLDGKRTRMYSKSSYINWISFQGMKKLSIISGFGLIDLHPIKSPSSKKGLLNFFSNLYFSIISFLSRLNPFFIDYLPKYLILLKK